MSVIEAQKVLLTHVALADGPIHDAEVQTAIAIAEAVGSIGKVTPKDVANQVKYLRRYDLEDAISQVRLLPPPQIAKLIPLMWIMAMSDGPVNAQEEAVIFDLAGRLGVSREAALAHRPAIGIGADKDAEKG